MCVTFNYTAHRQMWDWLAHHPLKEKIEWPEWRMNDGEYDEVQSNCFACEYVHRISPIRFDLNGIEIVHHNCRLCPFGHYTDGDCLGGLYMRWVIAGAHKDAKARAEYAAVIRDLPARRTDMWRG